MKKIIYTLLAIISFAGISSNANAANEFNTMGDRSCGDWITEKERSPIKSTSADNKSWLTGFLTGLSIGLNKDILKGEDFKSLIIWTDNYCRKNPLKTIGNAGSELFLELVDKKRLK